MSPPSTPSRNSRSGQRQAEASGRAARSAGGDDAPDEWIVTVAGLSYTQARTAMDLAIAQLQSEDLEVEQMAALYRRALACADRCEQLLAEVELDVTQLDPDSLLASPPSGDHP